MKEKIKSSITYFSRWELILWSASALLIAAAHLAFDAGGPLTLAASLIGASAILLNAKGNPIGQLLIIVFSVLYGVISYSFAYYGEMATYLGMAMPMAVFALIAWLKNPYAGKRSEVRASRLGKNELPLMLLLTVCVSAAFYFILRALNTPNLAPSTLSVATSFAAAYLTFRRNPWFSFVDALNDAVLIVLWTLASLENARYISVIVCFTVFLINDVYAFKSWLKMERRQRAER